ncbi:MAG: folP [Frankiales bacterium]|nr:folP [Frankiales bacterium]
MGVLNVTPDSFSDGGDHAAPDAAIAHGRLLWEQGADLVDVGGESTRPGAQRIPVEEELRRVLPVISALTATGVSCSVDTMRAEVAAEAVAAGAVVVNDVSGGLADPEMLSTVSALGTPYIVMHWRGPSAGMQAQAQYGDVVAEVCAELADRVAACRTAGISELVVDPGLGFAKEPAHNWELLQQLSRLAELGPVLLGASRKRFLGELLDGREPKGRDAATTAITVLAAQQGMWGVRVHDVAGSVDAVRVVERLRHEAR